MLNGATAFSLPLVGASSRKPTKKPIFEDGIAYIGPGHWRVRARVRVNDKTVEKREDVYGTKQDAKLRLEQLKKEIRDGKKPGFIPSFAPQQCRIFRDVCEYYRVHNNVEENRYLDLVERALGPVPNEQIEVAFDDYIQTLKTTPSARTGKILSNKTINHHRDACITPYNFASKGCHRTITGITSNPLAGYDKLPTEGRDRVFENDEENRLKEAMLRLKSPLYQSHCFSTYNPVRQGDLINLRRENRNKDFIHFLPRKTRRKVPRETILVCIDDAQNAYWDGLPPDCPWLFPWIDENGNWRQLTESDFAGPWHDMLREAQIKNFTWHDQKHVALTWMLDNGFSEIEIKNLGIEYTSQMIARYYHKDAQKAINKWRKMNGFDLDGETQGLSNKAAKILLMNGFSTEQLKIIGLKFDVMLLQNTSPAQVASSNLLPKKCEDVVKTPVSTAA